MCDCDSAAPAFFEEKIVKALKEFQCSECRQPILAGERYRKTIGKWDNEFNIYRCCQACLVLWTSLVEAGGECICYTTLHENIAESWWF